ncbi:MAG: amidase family protein, partial [Proteobacteria bacterium]|nr:amidase family protein [Pseudomonadota bacterium]
MSDADIAYMPVTELVEKYRAKEISPVEATRIALDRIAMHNDKVNAFCYLDEDGAMASAKESEARWSKGEPIGLIDGVPLGVKDTLHAKGMPTRFGSHTTTDEPVDVDTSTTLACRNHGAVLLGKTTNPEFAIGPTTNSPLTGLTTNPWDPTKHAGGSTGGGAAAVAAGMGNTSLATDAGGSTRIPAALCGKVGFKATNFRIPTYPPPGMPSLSCPGAITHTVNDTALMMNVMTEPDSRDWLAAKPDGVDYLVGLEDGIKGLKIAYSPTLNGQAKYVDPEIAACVAAAVEGFKELGATVELAEPDIENPIPILSAYLISRITHRVRAMTEAQQKVVGPSIS